jgi:CelD/BcsL family acetyltransferase involved in cellulose biosynthesis
MVDGSQVIVLQPNDPQWMDYLSGKADASIFHHPAWARLLASCYGYRPFILARTGPGREIEAGIPFMEISGFVSGRRWVSLPFSDYCSPLYDDQAALNDLIGKLALLQTREKISDVELRAEYANVPGLHVYSEHVMHEAELGPDVEAVFKRVHEMHRRNIRLAKANDIRIVSGGELKHIEEFYRLHLRTRREQGVPIQPWRFFRELKSLFDQGLGFVLLAYKGEQCLAGAVFLHWQRTLTYKYGASHTDGLKFRPNNLLMWTAMEWGCANGYTRFDLGRTDLANQGLRTFKSRWGAREFSLCYASLEPRLHHAKAGRLMDLSHVVIRNSPLWVCRFTGEVLYKFFG